MLLALLVQLSLISSTGVQGAFGHTCTHGSTLAADSTVAPVSAAPVMPWQAPLPGDLPWSLASPPSYFWA